MTVSASQLKAGDVIKIGETRYEVISTPDQDGNFIYRVDNPAAVETDTGADPLALGDATLVERPYGSAYDLDEVDDSPPETEDDVADAAYLTRVEAPYVADDDLPSTEDVRGILGETDSPASDPESPDFEGGDGDFGGGGASADFSDTSSES